MAVKLIVLTFLEVLVWCQADYYWRPYRGTIPDDAVNATSTRTLYVGFGPVFREGDFVGELYKDATSIFISAKDGDLHFIHEYLLVLSSDDSKGFEWVEADYTVLDSIRNKVEVGYEISGSVFGTLYVGRGLVDDVYRVGKVVGYNPSSLLRYNQLYVADAPTWNEIHVPKFEVLVYNKNNL